MATFQRSDGSTYTADEPAAPGDKQVGVAGVPTQATGPGGSTTEADVQNQINNQNAQDAATAKAAADAKAASDLAAYQAQQVNNHYNYGGVAGGAQASTNFFNGQGIGAEGRSAPTINYTDANADRSDNLMARAGQTSIAEAMRQRALGRVPTIASMEADRQTQQLAAQQTSAAASARGPAAMALAQQGAAANTAAGESNISNAAQINSANERRQDEVSAFGAQTGIRQGDQSMQTADAQKAQAQAAQEAQQRALNDQYANANYDRGVKIQGMQLDAQGHQIDTAVGASTASANRDAATNIATANRNAGYITAGIGAGGAIGGALLGAAAGSLFGSGKDTSGVGSGENQGSDPNATPGNNGQIVDTTTPTNPDGSAKSPTDESGVPKPYADGGTAPAGKPALVGERGPELVVPKQDVHVFTAEQTKAMAQKPATKPAPAQHPIEYAAPAPVAVIAAPAVAARAAPTLATAMDGAKRLDALQTSTLAKEEAVRAGAAVAASAEQPPASGAHPIERQPTSFTREHPQPPNAYREAAENGMQTMVEMAHSPPMPGAPVGMLDPLKAVVGAGQAAALSAEGLGRGYDQAKPHILEAKKRGEAAVDEAALRARNVGRAAMGHPLEYTGGR